MIYVLYSLSL